MTSCCKLARSVLSGGVLGVALGLVVVERTVRVNIAKEREARCICRLQELRERTIADVEAC